MLNQLIIGLLEHRERLSPEALETILGLPVRFLEGEIITPAQTNAIMEAVSEFDKELALLTGLEITAGRLGVRKAGREGLASRLSHLNGLFPRVKVELSDAAVTVRRVNLEWPRTKDWTTCLLAGCIVSLARHLIGHSAVQSVALHLADQNAHLGWASDILGLPVTWGPVTTVKLALPEAR